jgi:hypothetical protein
MSATGVSSGSHIDTPAWQSFESRMRARAAEHRAAKRRRRVRNFGLVLVGCVGVAVGWFGVSLLPQVWEVSLPRIAEVTVPMPDTPAPPSLLASVSAEPLPVPSSLTVGDLSWLTTNSEAGADAAAAEPATSIIASAVAADGVETPGNAVGTSLLAARDQAAITSTPRETARAQPPTLRTERDSRARVPAAGAPAREAGGSTNTASRDAATIPGREAVPAPRQDVGTTMSRDLGVMARRDIGAVGRGDSATPQPTGQRAEAAMSLREPEAVAPRDVDLMPQRENDTIVRQQPETSLPPPAVPAALPSAVSDLGNRVTDVPAPAAASAPPSASSVDPTRARAAVRGTIERYRSAYERLDAAAARAVWPMVDADALSRAFESLQSQRVSFEDCSVLVAGSTADATCNGRATVVPKIGGGTQTVRRTWRFKLAQDGDHWLIASATVR